MKSSGVNLKISSQIYSLMFRVMIVSLAALYSCTTVPVSTETYIHHVIFDTDANNEIDDQHALAYLLFSGDVFAVEGVTVNATSGPRRVSAAI
jgi:purine nucleosidase